MINNKEILITIGVSLALVAGLAFWYSYEPAPERTAVPQDLPEVEQLESDEVVDSQLLPEGEVEGVVAEHENDITNQIDTDTMFDSTNPVATITTSLGVIALELFQSDMPITVGNFIALANDGFYDGIKFHRVIPGFMIQGGDPNTREEDTSLYGQGGPGYTIQDEFVEGEHLRNLPGTISMANTGQPNSGGSQFFINVADNRNLDFDTPPMQSRHPVFGQVLEGMDVVSKIENVETGARDIPVTPVVIESITIAGN